MLCEVYRISSSSGQDSSMSSYDDEDDVETPKTPKRVTFGGELIKFRSPDVSDDPEVIIIKRTAIPVPVKPALNVPKHPKDGVNKKPSKLPLARQVSIILLHASYVIIFFNSINIGRSYHSILYLCTFLDS